MDLSAHVHHNGTLSSPMPGRIVKILAQEGDVVKEGQCMFVVESMKMLNEVHVPKHGTVSDISVKEGDDILPNNRLASIV